MTKLAGKELLDPTYYAREGYPHETFARLRGAAPVHRIEAYEPPFWALTRRADIVEVARQPERFASGPRFQILVGAEYGSGDAREPETLVQMDPPKHGQRRSLLSRRFTPRALRGLRAEVEQLAVDVLDELEASGSIGECDFVERIAAPLPIAVIARLMGLPRADWSRLFDWTNAVAGATDPEFQRPGETPQETRLRATQEVYDYFAELGRLRSNGNGTDLVSLLSRARVDGEPLPPHELVSYFLLLVVGGNETTRNALSGGLLALMEHPQEWRRLREEPGLVDRACEEILRWTSPVVHNARTAVVDSVVGGHEIRAGETLVLFWPSANRDEELFEQPDRFRIDRHPNPHLAFGIGEHICMGAHLARMELRAALRAIVTRFETIEQAGPVTRLQSSSVGGVKSLPIRYRFTPRGPT
jgi:cholest-4-en-3-one 26-monooxygenase